jgi:hypothetical protein
MVNDAIWYTPAAETTGNLFHDGITIQYPVAFDTSMLVAYAAIAIGSPDACVRKCTSFLTALLAMSMVSFHRDCIPA